MDFVILDLYTEHPVLIKNSHLTSVQLTASNMTLDTPNLRYAYLQPSTLNIQNCNVTTLVVMGKSDPVQFGAMNVDWYKLKQLVVSDNKTYWSLIENCVPADAKINYINSSDVKFRVTEVSQNGSGIPMLKPFVFRNPCLSHNLQNCGGKR